MGGAGATARASRDSARSVEILTRCAVHVANPDVNTTAAVVKAAAALARRLGRDRERPEHRILVVMEPASDMRARESAPQKGGERDTREKAHAHARKCTNAREPARERER